MMVKDINIVFCSQVLFCLSCCLGIEGNKIFTSGVEEDHLDQTEGFKIIVNHVSSPFDSLLDNNSYNNTLCDLFVKS